MSVLQATTAPPAAAGAEHHAAATCASFGTPAEHAQTGALNLTLPIPYGRHATIERRFSPTRFIRRHAAVVPALGLASAADKRYSLELMRNALVALLLLLTASAASAQELLLLRMGSLNLSVPSTWKFEGGPNQRVEGKGPGGEGVIANYRFLKPGAPAEVVDHHWKTIRGFASERMPGLASKNGDVLRPLAETALPGNRVQYSTVSQGKKALQDYYFLQYLLGSSRLMVYMTVEGYGNASEAASRFEAILGTQRWEE